VSNSGHVPELRKQGVLSLSAITDEYQAGVTYGSTAVTSSDNPFTAAMVGRAIQFGSDTVHYRIGAFTSASQITLDRAYLGDTDADTTLFMGQDTYELPSDFNELLSKRMINLVTGTEVEEIDPTEMRAKKLAYGLTIDGREPYYITIHGKATDNSVRLAHIDCFCGQIYALEYEYEAKHAKLTADDTEVFYPEHMFLAITDNIIARVMRDHEQAQTSGQLMQDAAREMANARKSNLNGQDKLAFKPALRTRGKYRRR